MEKNNENAEVKVSSNSLINSFLFLHISPGYNAGVTCHLM
jgi:hypothetical protein